MTITPITPTRARLRAARERAAQDNPNVRRINGEYHATPEMAAIYDRIQQRADAHRASAPELPYRWNWVTGEPGIWTLVVRVRATGQRIPISYNIPDAPDVVDADVVAARLMRFAKGVGR